MIDQRSLDEYLGALQLTHWRDPIHTLLQHKLDESAHGDFARWRETVEELPAADVARRRELLLELSPWRKGPFDLDGVAIDAEWRSDLKWQRLQGGIAPLDGRAILDVGCGNGFYALRMKAAGARCVFGVDPTLLFVMQFLAVQKFVAADNVFVLPARLEDLPLPARQFDTTFSMGVLYHRRSPIDHLKQLQATLRPGGQLVLETIYLPGDTAFARTPTDRYARMRNVWLLPTLAELEVWLNRCGFIDVDIVDRSVTTVDEQRRTAWMTFESLEEALDPTDPLRTVEGWPAPHRVVVTATAK